MSSKSSLSHLRSFVSNDLGSHIPKKLQPLFLLGVKAFALQPLTTCNGNARSAHEGSRAAAEQQMYRLLHHSKIFLLLWRAVAQEHPLRTSDVVNVDYSNLGSLAILGFAKQTRRGRAIPVLMRALASNTQGHKKTHPKYLQLKTYYQTWKKTMETDQFGFVIKSLRLLRYLYHVQPSLVFDRGFVNQGIIQFLTDQEWLFYMRMRDDFRVTIKGRLQHIGGLPQGEYVVVWAERTLRLIVTKPRSRYSQPWYIITNDWDTAPLKVAKLYYHRFEIEESFRDIKSLFRLRWMRLRSWQSLRVILSFMSLGIMCALQYISAKTAKSYQTLQSKKQLSVVRIWQEELERDKLKLVTRKLTLLL